MLTKFPPNILIDFHFSAAPSAGNPFYSNLISFLYFYSFDFEFDAFFLATLFLFDFFVCASIEGKSTHEKKSKEKKAEMKENGAVLSYSVWIMLLFSFMKLKN